MLSPNFFKYFLGLFPFFIFLPFSFKEIVRKKKLQLLFIWLITYFVLVYLPLSFQRRLVMGIFVPLGILAGTGLSNLTHFFKKYSFHKCLVCSFVIFSVLFLSFRIFFILDLSIYRLKEKSFPLYLSEDFVASFDWLKNNVQSDEVIFSSYWTGNFIPRYSGKKVFLGHWAQTIFAQEKIEIVKDFFSDKLSEEEINKLFKNHNIQYIFYSQLEEEIGKIDLDRFGNKVFENNEVKIIKIAL